MAGHNVTDKNFKNKWLLVYFGFTNCPDICPEVLDNLSTMIDRCNDVAIQLQPLFVTVDSHRDDWERIKLYLKDFHPNFIGLTGSQKELNRLYSAFGVYARANPSDDDGDYIVDHTIITYLVSPDGRVLELFTKSQDQDMVFELICKHFKNYKPVDVSAKPYGAKFQ